MSEPLPIAVLVSGGGTNLQALLDTVHGREAEVVAVASSTPDAYALQRARERDVATAVFVRADYPDRHARDEALADWIAAKGARLVVLAGYMELLGEAFLDRFPGAVVNVHPSLLPAFPGIGAVEQALAYGVKVFGVTVHFVDAGVDTGPVILQRAIELPGAGERRGGARGAAPARARAAAGGGAAVRRRRARGRPREPATDSDGGVPARPPTRRGVGSRHGL